MASVATPQLCVHIPWEKLYINTNKWVWLCYNKALFTKTGGGPDVACRLQFAHPWFREKQTKKAAWLMASASPEIAQIVGRNRLMRIEKADV